MNRWLLLVVILAAITIGNALLVFVDPMAPFDFVAALAAGVGTGWALKKWGDSMRRARLDAAWKREARERAARR